MHTSAALAKKLGLEHYLDKPAELNRAIFNLMLLQETIQLEQARKKRRDCPDSEAITVRRIATGKFTAGAMGDAKFRYAVETALKASTDILAVFQRARFVNMLRNIGMPDDVIDSLCDTVSIDDNTHCGDPD
jgi:hypothetical protein